MISCLCKSLYFHIFFTTAVVISLQKPPLCFISYIYILYFIFHIYIFLTTAVVISLQKPPLCGGGADELWSNRDPILSFTSKYPQIRTIPNILIISTDSHNSKYPHIMISQDLRNIYNYPQHNQRSKEYQKAAKSKQWQKKRTTQILPKARHTWDLGACYQNACWGVGNNLHSARKKMPLSSV